MPERRKKRKSVFLRLGILLIAVYLIVSLTTLQINLMETRGKLEMLQSDIEQRKLKNAELLKLLDTGSEKDFIERAARDRLGYVYADEIVYTDISGR